MGTSAYFDLMITWLLVAVRRFIGYVLSGDPFYFGVDLACLCTWCGSWCNEFLPGLFAVSFCWVWLLAVYWIQVLHDWD